jgi:hypothetical protein
MVLGRQAILTSKGGSRPLGIGSYSSSRRCWTPIQGTVSFVRALTFSQFHIHMLLVHAWDYRRYILAEMPIPRPETNELAYTSKKIEANFSNFSAWHQRSKILASLWSQGKLDEAKSREEGRPVSRMGSRNSLKANQSLNFSAMLCIRILMIRVFGCTIVG